MTTSCVVDVDARPAISVMPGDGAVWPAMVRNGSVILISCRSRSMTPPTSNTTMRGPASRAPRAASPGPLGASVVTRMILPPRPPGVCAARPARPGNASVVPRRARRQHDGETQGARRQMPATDMHAPLNMEPPARSVAVRGLAKISTSLTHPRALSESLSRLPARIVNDTGFLYTTSRAIATPPSGVRDSRPPLTGDARDMSSAAAHEPARAAGARAIADAVRRTRAWPRVAAANIPATSRRPR